MFSFNPILNLFQYLISFLEATEFVWIIKGLQLNRFFVIMTLAMKGRIRKKNAATDFNRLGILFQLVSLTVLFYICLSIYKVYTTLPVNIHLKNYINTSIILIPLN